MIANPPIVRFDNRNALAEHLAGLVAKLLQDAISERGSACLILSGGSTPRAFLKRLADQPVEWEKVSITLADERLVPQDDERSNFAMLRTILGEGSAGKARIVALYDGQEKDRHAAARDAENELRDFGAADVCVLGMGNDGHTASLFPGGDNLEMASDPTCDRRIVAMSAPGAPEPRITFTAPAIARSENVILHIEGEEKMATLESALQVQNRQASPILYILEQAAGKLRVVWAP